MAIGVFENAIVANSNPDVGGTDAAAITPPYDITNDKNATLFQNIRDLFYITNPQLREEWKTAPQAQTVRDEILIRNEKVCLRRNYLKRNKKTMTFNKGIRRLLLSAHSKRPITLQFLRTKRQTHANRQRQQELHADEVDVDEDDEDATGLNGNIAANRVSPAPIVYAPEAPVTINPAAGSTAVPSPSPPRSRHHQQTYE